MLYSGTDPESYITEYTLVYEEKHFPIPGCWRIIRFPEHLFWEGTTRTEDAQGTPTQSHISPSILVY